MEKKFDFSGYATRNNIKCSDGRVIEKDAFKHLDGTTVPLVWQHMHNDPDNVLGQALLENKDDGVYVYGMFNDTPSGLQAKELVKHKDVTNLSIYANQLKQEGAHVVHGMIREVSLVLAGANPGAYIDNVSMLHSEDGTPYYDVEEAIIYNPSTISLDNVELKHTEEEKNVESEKTVKDVFDTLTEEQKDVVYALIGKALKGDEEDSDEMEQTAIQHTNGGQVMARNVFENQKEDTNNVLSHAEIKEIFAEAQRNGSLRDAFLAHAGDETGPVAGVDYGIKDIDLLFPDHRNVNNLPTFIQREMGWVPKVMAGVRNVPFTRIKSMAADITEEEARAKGYIKGTLKKEEVFKLLKRVTNPTTIYKKQKLDRDDVLDITDFDVVAWLKAEMRMMLDEEIARAVLIGDGRSIDHPDKISEENIRPIAKEAKLYAPRVTVKDNTPEEFIESVIRSKKLYKGKGVPTLYTTTDIITDMLLMKDTLGRRIYNTEAELKAALRVGDIVEVPVMEGLKREVVDALGEVTETYNIKGIIVNLNDYAVGADKGGNVSLFDDFDIDYNQMKYLMETRISGALLNPGTALVLEVKEPVEPDPAG